MFFLIIFLLFFILLYYNSFPPPPFYTTPHPLLLHLFLDGERAPLGNKKNVLSKWSRTNFLSPALRLNKVLYHREYVSKSHFVHQGQVLVLLWGAPQKTKLLNCHPDAEGRGRSHISPLTVHPESTSSHKLRSLVSLGFPVMILTLSTLLI